MYMMLNNDNIIQLAHTKVNKNLLCGCINLQVKSICKGETNPCKYCTFMRKNGCSEDIHRMKYACMGRFREDGNSVVFIKDNK